jgi:hypothetical protein
LILALSDIFTESARKNQGQNPTSIQISIFEITNSDAQSIPSDAVFVKIKKQPPNGSATAGGFVTAVWYSDAGAQFSDGDVNRRVVVFDFRQSLDCISELVLRDNRHLEDLQQAADRADFCGLPCFKRSWRQEGARFGSGHAVGNGFIDSLEVAAMPLNRFEKALVSRL